MSLNEIVETASFGDWVSIIFFLMYGPIVLAIPYWALTRRNLFGNPVEEIKAWKKFANEVSSIMAAGNQDNGRKIKEYDYWDFEEVNYETGEVGANAGPAIRHPKNRDRAYSGSAERFHDGSGQNS